MTTAEDRVEAQPAYVIHTRPYRDTSALVDFFTEEFGRVRAVVKGVRKPKSRLREAVQSFLPLQVAWRGRGDLKTLVSAEAQGINPFLQGQALWCGLYLNELVMRLLPQYDSYPRLFAYYRLTLSGLKDPDTREPVLRVFERRLLEELGFGFSLESAMPDGAPIMPDQHYYFELERGFVRFAPGDPTLPVSRLYPGATVLAMGRDDYGDEKTRRCAKRLMRQALAPLLGGNPLQSRALFSGGAGSGRNPGAGDGAETDALSGGRVGSGEVAER